MRNRDYGALRADDPKNLHFEDEIKVVAAATDFTALATAAVRRAAQVCRANDARMHLIHVMSARSRLSTSAAVARLRETAARITAGFDVTVDTHLAIGGVSREIAALARSAEVDLVVLGNSRKSFFAEILGINTALRVQRRTDLPLLAVSSTALRPYIRALLATDLSPEAALAGQRARRFFPDPTLIVLHAYESPYTGMLGTASVTRDVIEGYRRRAELEGVDRLRAFVRNASLENNAILRVDLGHPALSARRQARELEVDLVVLRPTKRWLTSGVTEHLLADPPCDLLLMP